MLSAVAAGPMAVAASIGLLVPVLDQGATASVAAAAAAVAVSFALAGGAMLALVVVDFLRDAWQHGSHLRVAAGTGPGAGLMPAVGLAFGV